MRTISELIEEFGEEDARLYLLEYFRDWHNLKDFVCLFPDHFENNRAPYQTEFMTDAGNPDIPRVVGAAPRGSGKSTTVDIAILAWFALYNISPFSILVSDTLGQAALQLGSLASELTSNSAIKWLFGDIVGETWGTEMIVIKTRYGESAIIVKGAGQKFRGLKWRNFRPRLVIIDDLENDELVESFDRRKKLENWFRFSLLRAMAKDKTKIIYIGTVLHDKALLKRIIDGDVIFGLWVVHVYKAIKSDNTSFWESRFPLEWLIGARDDPKHPHFMGSLVFAQEMQQEPASEQDRIIQEGWIQWYSEDDKEENWLENCEIIAAVDPAIEEDKSKQPSEFVFHIFAKDKEGHWWKLYTKRGRMDINRQIDEIVEGLRRFRVDVLGIESIAYQRVLGQLIKTKLAQMTPSIYVKIVQLMTDKSKKRRMTLHSSKFQGGFVHLNKEDPESQILAMQLVQFPAEPNDSADCTMLAFETVALKRKAKSFANKPIGF